ncbi:type 4a pilus biogenesis protein PilO [bacterium]|nr:type 4a pilus biogenesis protein PilO [candidate division CSSED10-310 bacterium]
MQIIETLEKIPDWQKYGVVALIVVGLCIYFYSGIYKPKTEQIERLQAQINQLEIKINRGLAMKNKLEEFRKEVYVLREKMRQAEEILGNKPAVDELVQTIESLASQVNLKPIKFDPMPERKLQFYGEVPINLEVTGRYHEFGKFYEKIANESRILNVTNMSMKGGRDMITTTCLLTAFWYEGGA